MIGYPIAIGDLMPLILTRVRAAVEARQADRRQSEKPERVKEAAQ